MSVRETFLYLYYIRMNRLDECGVPSGEQCGGRVVGAGFHQGPFKVIWPLKYCVFYFFEHKKVI